jgi:hypothetical protein
VGATTFSIRVVSITTLSIRIVSITAFSIRVVRITAFSIRVVNVVCVTTLSIRTVGIMTLSVTLSKCVSQHNDARIFCLHSLKRATLKRYTNFKKLGMRQAPKTHHF